MLLLGIFRPVEVLVIGVIAILFISAIGRTQTLSMKTNIQLLVANWFVVIALVLSLKPVYEAVDPLAGGHNYTNLLQRVLIAYAGYAVTYSLAEVAWRLDKENKRPACMSIKWFYLSLAGTVVTFWWMGAAARTSRGLEGFAENYLAYTIYQCSLLIGLLAGAHYLVPRLWEIAKSTEDRRFKIQLHIFNTSYLCAAASVLLFILTPLSPVIVMLREFFIYATFTSLAAGFTMINRERRNLIVSSGKLRRE